LLTDRPAPASFNAFGAASRIPSRSQRVVVESAGLIPSTRNVVKRILHESVQIEESAQAQDEQGSSG
jgi:hypothetical protein